MDRFARTVIGYHGCQAELAQPLLNGSAAVSSWRPSQNNWDWLGHGIYFWEHSPKRAWRWAQERWKDRADVIGAVIQLDRCFDLLNEECGPVLKATYDRIAIQYVDGLKRLPTNRGRQFKLRQLDCLVINLCLDELKSLGFECSTVRGAFWEGEPVYPGAGIASESHLQIAVRNPSSILGVFRPNLVRS